MAGFEDFAAPPRPQTLHAAAGDGTVVALVASEHGSAALLLTGTEADHLPLPGLTVLDARTNAVAFLAALNPPPDEPVDDAEVTRVLRWLWDTVAGPVLTRLGCTAGPGDPDAPHAWPRIWWIATGPLSVLPIHAAGHHDDPPATRRTVLDRVVSSYAPSVRALADARLAEREPGRDVLAVGINQTADPASPALPRAEREAHAVALQLDAAGTALVGPSATLDAVRGRLGAAAWAHFSCHGRADDNDPARSFLDLFDEPLRAGELFTLHPLDPYLAYLSACTTAVGSFRLLDESVHLASAFQLAGYPHVIATLWWVNDVVSTRLSTAVYGAIHPDPHSWRPPAHALHRAVHTLRTRYRDYPQVWAAHIHLGP
ncbi:CHAT domain-containing protein [Dactylosporangium cerinum]